MNKLTAAILIIVAIIAFSFYQTSQQNSPMSATLAELDTCSTPPSTCNGDTLTLYRCVNNVSTAFHYNCTELSDSINNWTCNSKQIFVREGVRSTRANCDVVNMQAYDNAQNASKLAVNGSRVTNAVQNTVESSPALAYCGNEIIDNGETCVSCPSDFKCTATQACDANSGICKEKNAFGDDKCTAQEKQLGTDCSTCGCTNGNICNSVSKRCELAALLTSSGVARINEIVTNYTSKYNYTFVSSTDMVYANQSAKLIAINCNPRETFFCRIFLIVDKDGNELAKFQTT